MTDDRNDFTRYDQKVFGWLGDPVTPVIDTYFEGVDFDAKERQFHTFLCYSLMGALSMALVALLLGAEAVWSRTCCRHCSSTLNQIFINTYDSLSRVSFPGNSLLRLTCSRLTGVMRTPNGVPQFPFGWHGYVHTREGS